MITINVPGKLMLTGEWAIREPGNRCIVMAIDRHVTATIIKASTITFNLPDIGLPSITAIYTIGHLVIATPLTHEQEKKISMCRAAAETALGFVQQPTPFTLSITSNISRIPAHDGTHHKLGFGSSAATVVATIKAILAFHGFDITTQETLSRIFNLAVTAHNTAQTITGSGFDIAAATYGTTISYERTSSPRITPITLPKDLILLVGFSGTSASTSHLITAMQAYQEQDTATYHRICADINTCVIELEKNIANQNIAGILEAINHNQKLLAELAQSSGINLETPALTKLITIAQAHGAAAKFSGAGGGDCGIAVCTNAAMAENIKRNWQTSGIIPLDVKGL